jgi:hypothetical protein
MLAEGIKMILMSLKWLFENENRGIQIYIHGDGMPWIYSKKRHFLEENRDGISPRCYFLLLGDRGRVGFGVFFCIPSK